MALALFLIQLSCTWIALVIILHPQSFAILLMFHQPAIISMCRRKTKGLFFSWVGVYLEVGPDMSEEALGYVWTDMELVVVMGRLNPCGNGVEGLIVEEWRKDLLECL